MSTIYRGMLGKVIVRLKRLSLAGSALSVACAPVLVILGNENVPLAGRITISSTVVLCGVGSTLALNYLCRPYVTELSWSPETSKSAKQVTVKTYDWLTRPVVHSFNLEDVQPPNVRPFVSFYAEGRPYFVHTESLSDFFEAARQASQHS